MGGCTCTGGGPVITAPGPGSVHRPVERLPARPPDMCGPPAVHDRGAAAHSRRRDRVNPPPGEDACRAPCVQREATVASRSCSARARPGHRARPRDPGPPPSGNGWNPSPRHPPPPDPPWSPRRAADIRPGHRGEFRPRREPGGRHHPRRNRPPHPGPPAVSGASLAVPTSVGYVPPPRTTGLDGRLRPAWTVTGLRPTGPRSAGRPATVRSRSCGTSRGRGGPSSRR